MNQWGRAIEASDVPHVAYSPRSERNTTQAAEFGTALGRTVRVVVVPAAERTSALLAPV